MQTPQNDQNNDSEIPLSEIGDVISMVQKLRLMSRASKLMMLQEVNRLVDEEEMVIQHTNGKFVFPLPVGAIGKERISAPWTNWKDPPFYNRQQTLLSLLRDCYTNFTRTNQIKPIAAVVATSTGYGKTRLLLEWAIRVFHTPEVLQAFIDVDTLPLQNQRTFEQLTHEILTSFNIAPSDDKRNRAMFLVNLHETLSRSMVISASMAEWDNKIHIENPQDEREVFNLTDRICREIVIANICRRFQGRHTLNGSEIFIPPFSWNTAVDEDKKWLIDNKLLNGTHVFYSLMDLFITLVNQTTKLYHSSGIGLNLEGQLLLVNLDEAGKILKTDVQNRVLAYKIMEHFYNYQPSYSQHNVKIFMLMVGLFTTTLSKLEDPMKIIANISLPLNPLLSHEYCTSLCERIVGGPLTSAASAIVRILWKRCLGIPRAIQVLHGVLVAHQNQLKSTKISADSRKKIFADFETQAEGYFKAKLSLEHNDLGLEQKIWHKELLELSLCISKPQNAVIGQTNYNDLEGKGIIFPVHFGSVERNSATRAYTLPFHFYGAELTGISAQLWPAEASLENFTCFSSTLFDIVGGDGAETDPSLQGDRLEKACAASILARYQLKANNQYQYINMKDLVSNWSFDHHFVRLTGILTSPKQITVEHYKKTKNAKEQDEENWTFDHLLPSLCSAQAVIINGKNSKFADVFVPILTLQDAELQQLKKLAQKVENKSISEEKLLKAEEQYKRLLLIQCKNVQPDSEDLKPSKIKKDFEAHLAKVVASGHIFMVLSPDLPTTPLDQRLSEHQQFFITNKGKIIESNGEQWLSELFILVYRLGKDAVKGSNTPKSANKNPKSTAQGKNNNNQEEDASVGEKKPKEKKEKPKPKAKKGQKHNAGTQDEKDTSTEEKSKSKAKQGQKRKAHMQDDIDTSEKKKSKIEKK